MNKMSRVLNFQPSRVHREDVKVTSKTPDFSHLESSMNYEYQKNLRSPEQLRKKKLSDDYLSNVLSNTEKNSIKQIKMPQQTTGSNSFKIRNSLPIKETEILTPYNFHKAKDYFPQKRQEKKFIVVPRSKNTFLHSGQVSPVEIKTNMKTESINRSYEVDLEKKIRSKSNKLKKISLDYTDTGVSKAKARYHSIKTVKEQGPSFIFAPDVAKNENLSTKNPRLEKFASLTEARINNKISKVQEFITQNNLKLEEIHHKLAKLASLVY